MSSRTHFPTLAALLLILAAPWSSAGHTDEDRDVAFDHKTGNEWWVEVTVMGDQPFDAVGARDDGGEWVGLTKNAWGVWAGSFHIEPGHRVQFEAVDTVHAGERTRSCWFTHPEGVEECGTASDPAPSEATFDHTGGNEWWVQVDVSGSPDRVQAMGAGGAWTDLQHKDWGDWAASFHVEPGHDVRFRAMTDDAWRESCWFTHPGGKAPDGSETCSTGSSEPPSGGDFDASFGTPGGNEWWVEVYVDSNEPLAGVDARDDGGAWIALDNKDWGAWAKSFHVQDGSLVEFRATSPDGETDISGQYRWPEGTQMTDEPHDGQDPQSGPSTTDVAFGPKAGNEWWVETIAVGDGEPVTAVEGRAAGGQWHPMTYRPWGAWAASFHVPSGTDVEFRATTSSGTDTSVRFTWPDAKAVGGAGWWPQEGSYARYDSFYQEAPGIAEDTFTDYVYHDGAWWLHRYGEHEDPGGTSAIEEWGRGALALGPTDPPPGQFESSTFDTHKEGDPVTVAVWQDEHIPDCQCNNDYWEWEKATGIYVWKYNSGTSYSTHRLLDTDAPMQTA